MGRKLNLSEKRFGRWTVMQLNRVTVHGHTQWECKCDCGKVQFVNTSSLTKRHSTSCGCLRVEQMRKRFTTHGKSTTRLHSIWRGIKDRCFNPKNEHYRLYGKRGITLYSDWISDFQAFYSYVENTLGLQTLTIDRIDTNGNYEPGNLRWATPEQQSWNTRQIKGLYKGVSKTYYRKYKAQITCKGIKHYLGVFETETEAAAAYNKAAKKFFGKYAFLNKI